MTYLELDYQQLIDFANGKEIGGKSVAASPTTIIDTAPALTYLHGVNWTLVQVIIGGAKEIYLLSSS